MTQEKKILGVSTIAVIALILIAVGATYAFFKGTDAGDTDTPLEVTTNTTDSLVFNVDTDISMVADMSNFTEGAGNREGVSHATATLKANNKTNNATGNYYLYFDIKENELKYTRDDKTAELLLQVSGPDGLVTSIKGLNYVTVTDGKGEQVSGFDITEVQDLITITNNKEITTISEKVDTWEIKVILVNLNSDQSSNGGKKFNAKIEINKNGRTIGDVCVGQNMAQCMAENYEKDSHLLHHTAELANSAGDNSYRYAGSYEEVENYVCFGSDEATCPHDNLYRIIGVFDNQVKLIKADYAKSTELGTSGDYKSDYKTSGDWGTNKGSNTKSEIGGYYWNYSNTTSSKNIWAQSRLNTTNLNETYLNSFSESWQSKIATTTWKVGGNTDSKIYGSNAAVSYQNEIVNSDPGTSGNNVTTETKKIGLMYVSDYGFAAAPSAWTTNLSSYYTENIPNKNWMYGGLMEWTISRRSDSDDFAFSVAYGGNVGNNLVHNGRFAVRPVFYLESFVTLVSGSGKESDPYRIGQPNLGETCENQNLAECIKDNYKLDSNLLHHTSELANSANDNSYRYSGSYEEVNNYVCFGSDATTCPHDNLYRIIGVFDNQVKLIKADYAKSTELGAGGDYKDTYSEFGTNKGSNTKSEIGGYYWNYSNTTSSKNIWAESGLNKENLNGTYLSSFDESWQIKIATTTWKVGGNTWENIGTQNAATAYQNEIVSPAENTTESRKIGLMYVSDYMYGASPAYWTYKGNDTATTDYRVAINENWMYNGLYEWAISHNSDTDLGAFFVQYVGSVDSRIVYNRGFAVRPVFYLTPDVVKTTGTGTLNDPFRLQV